MKLRTNLFASGLQVAANQAAGLVLFYLLSTGLTKADFGELNWTLAVFLTVFAALSFGLDQLLVKKIAAGESKAPLLSAGLLHVLVVGLSCSVLLIFAASLFPSFFQQHPLLLWLGAGKTLLFFSTPFKALAAGRERFKLLLLLSVLSSLLKAAGVVVLVSGHQLRLATVLPLFVAADASELLAGLFLLRRILQEPYRFKIDWAFYKQVLKAALPQVGVAALAAALSRTDWILIGLFLPASILAEYSFAYKAFELASLPLLAVAPLLLPLFSRLTKEKRDPTLNPRIQILARTEMAVACGVSLCLVLGWAPVIDFLTAGRYAAVNTQTILLLSLTLPVLYLNNFLWTIHFASANLRLILRSFALAFVCNLALNLFFIPLWTKEGAALAYLFSLTLQTVYYGLSLKNAARLCVQNVAVFALFALCSGAAVRLLAPAGGWAMPLGAAFYLLFCGGDWVWRRRSKTIFRNVTNSSDLQRQKTNRRNQSFKSKSRAKPPV